jgi:hypothetical protein
VTATAWSNIAAIINLLTFFFAFSAFSVGLYISDRVKKALGRGMLAGVVDAHLVASGGLTVRTAMAVLAQLRWIDDLWAIAIGDLALLAMAAGLFMAYLAIERYFKKMEAKRSTERS